VAHADESLIRSQAPEDIGGDRSGVSRYESGRGRYESGRGGGRGGKGAWGTGTPEAARAIRSLTARTPGQLVSPTAPDDAAYIPYGAGGDLAWGLPPQTPPQFCGASAVLLYPGDWDVGASARDRGGSSEAPPSTSNRVPAPYASGRHGGPASRSRGRPHALACRRLRTVMGTSHPVAAGTGAWRKAGLPIARRD
jgi:hypothetical protein